MVYQINHDEVEMNNIPLITVEPLAEVLRSNGKKTLQHNGIAPAIKIYTYFVQINTMCIVLEKYCETLYLISIISKGVLE